MTRSSERPGQHTLVVRRWLVVLLGLLLVTSPAGAGDAELAKFLLQAGKAALAKGDPADALSKLEKAREEDATLVEVGYWIGAALEAKGDAAEAVESYRAFLHALGSTDAGEPSKELAALQKKAQARVDALDAARREIERAHDGFAAQMLELAGRVAATDPNLAERAVRLVLAVHPEHQGARDLLANLAASGGAAAPTSAALRGFPEVWDVVASHGLGGNDGWTYGEGQLEIRAGKGSLTRTPDGYDSGSTYGMEAEIALHSVLQADRVSVVGLSFGWSADNGYTLLLVNSQLELGTIGKRGKTQLAKAPVPPWQAGKRRTLAVRVEGRRVTGYVDGRSLIQKEFDAGTPLGGDIGIVVENAHFTLHRLVVARPAGGSR